MATRCRRRRRCARCPPPREHAREAVAWRGAHEALPPRRSRAAARRSAIPQSPETRAITAFRKHLSWYLKGYPVGGDVRRAASLVTSLTEVELLLAGLDPDAELLVGNERLVRSHSGVPAGWPSPPGGWATPMTTHASTPQPKLSVQEADR